MAVVPYVLEFQSAPVENEVSVGLHRLIETAVSWLMQQIQKGCSPLPAPTTSLIDASDSEIQSTDMADKLAESGRALAHLFPTRSASVVPNMLIKLQLKRLAVASTERYQIAIFTSRAEAEAWLDELG